MAPADLKLLIVTWRLDNSRLGLQLLAIREDETAAEALGVRTTRLKIGAFIASAIAPAAAGSLYATYLSYIDPATAFAPMTELTTISMVLLGGLGTVFGPLIGVVTMSVINELLWSRFPEFYLMLVGAVILLAILFMPRGIAGVAGRRNSLLLPVGRDGLPEMTVRENLELDGHLLGSDRHRLAAAMDRLCKLFPILGERMRQLAGNMSGGEQQMLAIARALVTGPSTVVLDEPSLGLSPKYVDIVFEKLTELAAEGLTIVIVEQKASRILTVVDYGYVMHTGRVAFRGPAAELLADERVKRVFLGEVPEEIGNA